MKTINSFALILGFSLASVNVFAFSNSPTCDHLQREVSDRKFLIVETRGGLGNRLGAIVTAYTLALEARRCLVIDWKVHLNNELDEGEMPVLFKDLFDSPLLTVQELADAAFISPTEREQLKEIESTGQAGFREFAFSTKAQRDDHRVFPWSSVGSSDFAPSILGATEKYLTLKLVRDVLPAYRSAADSALYFDFFRNLIKLKDSVQQDVDTFRSKHFPSGKDDVIVGVHFRSMSAAVGDGKNQATHNAVDGSTEELFQLFVERMRVVKEIENARGKNVAFFLASDDPSYLKRLTQRAFSKEEIIFYTHEEISRAGLKGQMSGVIDFALLGSCDYVVGRLQSTFSDLAAISTPGQFKIQVGAEWLPGPDGIRSSSFIGEFSKRKAADDPKLAEHIRRLSRSTPLEEEHATRRFRSDLKRYGLYGALGTLILLKLALSR